MTNSNHAGLVVTYAIDHADKLVNVNEEWTRFAQENEGGTRLHPESVIGQSLWTFVREDTLQQLYQQLVTTVRQSHVQVNFDFRCDSPRFRRHMHMTMTPREDNQVQFTSVTTRIEPRDDGLRAAAAFTGVTHVTRCSICNLYKLSDGRWSEVAAALDQDGLLNSNQRPRLIWGVCNPCKERLAATT
ncbi:MAG: hypothetical protein KDB23_08920 [Planctomycetales bacterium]|nr:hypothetical protein [Planctomycetales bacterium]